MNIHKNARLTPRGRERIVRQVENGQAPEVVAEAAGVCPRTVRKWVDRYRREGLAGLQDRSSRPHRLDRPTPQAVIEKIERLRRQRWTGKQIAVEVGVSSATVCRVLRRLGLNKLNALEPAEPVRHYERENPGELIHLDIKKLGRIGSVGYRITAGRKSPTPGRSSPWHWLGVRPREHRRHLSIRHRQSQGQPAQECCRLHPTAVPVPTKPIRVQRVMTDNGSCYRSRRSRQPVNASALTRSSLGHTPNNGKAERFISKRFANGLTLAPIRTGSAIGRVLRLAHPFNWHQPHGSNNTPISRLGLSEDNLLRLHS